jgi:hypothetical protein
LEKWERIREESKLGIFISISNASFLLRTVKVFLTVVCNNTFAHLKILNILIKYAKLLNVSVQEYGI